MSVGDDLALLTVLALVLFAPGAALIAMVGGFQSAVPGYLAGALAILCTIMLTVPATLVTLSLSLPNRWVGFWLVGATGICTAVWALRRARGWHSAPPRGARWASSMHRGVLLVAAATAALAYLVRGTLDGDALFHTAFARKLAEYSSPSFDNTQAFVDGSGHPGYLVPAWHQLMGLAAELSGQDVARVSWLGPTIVIAVAVLATAGLAFVLLRSHLAAGFGALGFLAASVLAKQGFGPIGTAMYPGNVALYVVIPLAIACWVLALWHERRSDRLRALAVVALCVGAIVVLHVSYIAWLGIAIGGYLLLWAVNSPWPKRFVVRHLASAGVVGAVTVICVAALVPALSALKSFAGAASATDTAFAGFANLLVGDPSGYHLRVEYLVAAGALALLGTLATIIALIFRRDPVGWYVPGSTLLVLAISQSDVLFPIFVEVASMSQARRIGQALPVEVGIALMLMFSASLVGRARDASRRLGALLAVVVVVGGAVSLYQFVEMVPAVAGRRDPATAPAWPLEALTVLLAVAVALWTLAAVLRGVRSLLRRLSQRQSDPDAGPPGGVERRRTDLRESWGLRLSHPPLVPSRFGATVVMLAFVLGMAPTAARAAQDALADYRLERETGALRADALEPFDEPVRDALNDLPAGSVVMAQPSTSFALMAVAPVHVVASQVANVAETSANRRFDRYRDAQAFFGARTSDGERLELLRANNARAVVAERPREGARRPNPVVEYAARNPDVLRPLAQGEELLVYEVVAEGTR